MSSKITVKAVLFDMDGTLCDSTPAVNATWDYFAKEYNLNLEEVLKTSHGTRTVDNLRKWCGITDPKQLQDATELFESMIVTEAKRLRDEGKTGLQILPGVLDLLTPLGKTQNSWMIVTSATKLYASAAIPTAGIPKPPILITGDDVTKGKPDPEPYLAGARALGVDVKHCVIVEDAPSGIKSGVATGAKVLAVCTSHKRSQLEGLGATWIVDNLTQVKAILDDGEIVLEISA